MVSKTATPFFGGIWVPLVTPYREGAVDLDTVQCLAARMADKGVHGLVACGTTGEAALLDDDEQTAVLRAVQEAVGGRCPVIMGISGSDTRAMTKRVAYLDHFGVDGFLISPPAYVRPSQQGVILHFQALAAATTRPIILYDIPARTGVALDLATVATLAANPQFVAIKKCGGIDHSSVTDLLSRTPLTVLSGDDASLFEMLRLGGHGAIAAAAHIRPDLFVQVFDLVQEGEIGQARLIFNALLPLIRLLFSEPNPGPVKAALAMQGLIREELRLPMLPMSLENRVKLAVVLERVMAVTPEVRYPDRNQRLFPEYVRVT